MRLSVSRLSKAYGYLWAVKDLDIEFSPGECVALLGPNGAGKSTLLKLLSALIYPTAGEIMLDGEKLSRNSLALRSMIGFLSPNEHLYENLTSGENLALFTSLYDQGRSSEEIRDALERVGLKGRADEQVAAFSTGMKCRLSIAKWLLLNPGLLLLDEPYGVLDGSGVDLLEGFLDEQRRKGGVVVIATHHIARVLQLCTRGVILRQGKKIFDEPRRDPWENFYRAYREFLPHGER